MMTSIEQVTLTSIKQVTLTSIEQVTLTYTDLLVSSHVLFAAKTLAAGVAEV